ncbi:ComEC/Rec2 family competence protein [Tessaracoccus sp. OH4464_COT-324]|uniref:ComEC/Rec2 family competence protein n=1 Tax=Tessaracoccus sp. OH4464_COT-324 TaxID=2491059 RepID=UPI001F407158|nr:ComEC/Rec2 family competence protein [Tessaracoccus sp. OH4464_COT-324]
MSHDWRLVPAAVSAWAGAASGIAVGRPWIMVCVAMFVAAALLRRWPAVVVALVAFGLFGGYAAALATLREESPLSELAEKRASVRLEIRLLEEPKVSGATPPRFYAAAETSRIEAHGAAKEQRTRILLNGNGDEGQQLAQLKVGATYSVTVRLKSAASTEPFAAVANLNGVAEELVPAGFLHRIAGSLRAGLRAAMEFSPPDQAALVPSLVVGDTSRIDDTTRERFRTTGLTHLMAVSGANLALMLGVVLAAARAIGCTAWVMRVVGLLGVGGFIMICGPEPSVLRAAAMGIVATVGIGAGKGRRSLRTLAVAIVALLAFDPWLSWAAGFWLSVLACLGIVLLGPLFVERLTRWLPRWLAEAIAIPLAAQLATQPVVTGLSSQVSLVGILANVAAGPFVGPTTVLGFAASLLSMLPHVSPGVGWAAGWCCAPILWLANWCSSLPQPSLPAPGWPGVVLVTLGGLLLGWLLLRCLDSWLVTSALGALLLVLITVREPNATVPADWQVAFCDVGQGDATVLRAGPDSAVLVDSGPEPQPLTDCLAELGVRSLPLVVLTHYHADHVGGFDVVRDFKPELVLVSKLPSPVKAARRVAQASELDIRTAAVGEELKVGQVHWQTVSAWEPPDGDAEAEGESSRENDASVVGVATVGELRLLLPGDLEVPGQLEALRTARQNGTNLNVDVLKLPHHGSAGVVRSFLAASGARLAVVSAGAGNEYGHPSKRALDYAHSLGMQIIRTDLQGTLVLSTARGLTAHPLGK